MEKPLIIGNWKMHKTVDAAIRMVTKLRGLLSGKQDAQVVVMPPFASLHPCEIALQESSILLGAQNVSQFDQGAYTGEVSANMLLDLNCEYILAGHSERRSHFDETDAIVHAKIKQILEYEMRPVLCVGESSLTRKAQKTFDFIEAQIMGALRGINDTHLSRLVIAYEPIWAIGTGETAEPELIQEIHAFIRKILKEKFTKQFSQFIPIIYGGSVKPNNAVAILQQKDVGGVLVGGASLDAETFYSIVQSA